jgi:hypothetical protein
MGTGDAPRAVAECPPDGPLLVDEIGLARGGRHKLRPPRDGLGRGRAGLHCGDSALPVEVRCDPHQVLHNAEEIDAFERSELLQNEVLAGQNAQRTVRAATGQQDGRSTGCAIGLEDMRGHALV